MPFFWRYIFFFRYFLIILICNCLFVTFDIALLYYFNISSSIISCLSSGKIYFSLGISLWCSFVTACELFCCKFFQNVCDSVSNFITNQIISWFSCILNYSFWWNFKCICNRFFSTIKKFLTLLLITKVMHILSSISRDLAFW